LGQRYERIGRETLEIADTAPMALLRQIVEWQEDETDNQRDLTWPVSEDEDSFRRSVKSLFDEQTIEFLRPIEDRCVRINLLATSDGAKSLTHVAKERLTHEQYREFGAQGNELCRSIWMFLGRQQDFRDAEAFHAVRQYRGHGKMYDAFEADAGAASIAEVQRMDLSALASLVTTRLDLPSKVDISTLQLQATATHRPSLLVIVRHAGPLSSVFHHKAGGLRKTIYFRPSNEASLVWTPDEGLIEACGVSPQVRMSVAETFVEVVFKTDLSKKPLSWRYYDLSRFHSSLTLPLPPWDDVAVELAKVIEIEMRLGSWARRLSLRVTIDDDIEDTAKRWIGGIHLLKRVEGFSRVNLSVKYKRAPNKKQRSLEISFGDRRSNLQSKASVDDRDLGYRLLQYWGILKRLQPLEYEEITEILSQLLELHDLPDDEVSGGQLRRRGLDPQRLMDAGVIAFKARQSRILSDDSDGEVLIEAGEHHDQVQAEDQFKEPSGKLVAEDSKLYVLKRDWLDEIVLSALRPLIGKGRIENVTEDLISLGTWRGEKQGIPLFLVRRIDNLERLQMADLVLRSRHEGGIGVVLTAVSTPLTHLGPNVVVPLPGILVEGILDDDSIAELQRRYSAGRWLAMGGTEVALMNFANHLAMLYIPGKVPLPVLGPKQIKILDRLVKAHKASAPGVATGEVIEGTGVRSPADAWKSNVRKSVVGVYFENSQHGLWRLKPD
jgi:hypothetical protein